MILQTLKNLTMLVVLGFAVMGFVAVPLGEKTGFEHARDYWAREETQAARAQIESEVDELRVKAEAELTERSGSQSEKD